MEVLLLLFIGSSVLSFLIGFLFSKWKNRTPPIIRVRRYFKRDLPKDKWGYEQLPPFKDGPYCLLSSFTNEEPTGKEEYEAFYIGPIYGTAQVPYQIDITETEGDEYTKMRELIKILEQYYDHNLARDTLYCDMDRSGCQLFSATVTWIIEKANDYNDTYFLLDQFGKRTDAESISVEVKREHFFRNGFFQMYIIFSQYWDGKSHRILPSVFKQVQKNEYFSDNQLHKFELDEKNCWRHTEQRKKRFPIKS